MSYELDASEIEFLNELGEGTSAKVYKGTYRGQTVGNFYFQKKKTT